jgi:dipeptidyl aminopeptidase/acylaminoacyl peptidase
LKSIVCTALLATLLLSPMANGTGSPSTSAPATTTRKTVNIDAYIRSDRFESIKISPKGDYFAATVPLENGERTGLAIMRRADNSISTTFALDKNTHVADFHWVNPERLLISIAEKFGALETPQLTGELYAINADGSKGAFLVGQRMMGEGLGTRIQPRKVERIAAFLIDPLLNDDKRVIISVIPFNDDPFTRAEIMDVYTGRRAPVARAPVRNASFITDSQGVVRFAVGAGLDNKQQLHYREGEGKPWQLLHDQAVDDLAQTPIGFSADDRTAYLEVEQARGPNAIIAFDIATQARTTVLVDDIADPARILRTSGNASPVGALLLDGKPRTAFFDEQSEEARLYRSLEAAFGGEPLLITSQTADGKVALVQTWSDRSPGDFFLFDKQAKKAGHLLSRRDWFDPAQMAERRPVRLQARDGLALHGILTVPNGASGKNMPMVVMPHGGPFGIQDFWGFDTSSQMLAEAGYAVLQLNFRGSGGYGKAFTEAGKRQWGLAMQDDLTDATRWAIQQGVADANRICIYGASYGAYAALMGVAKEPDLYRCAVGYVGVYDLPTMHTQGDVQRRGSGATYLREWIGERRDLDGVSPNKLADKIKVPVFLAAGGRDERAPIQHSRLMERALTAAGVPVETLYYDNEGHGFYLDSSNREYYTRLLAFLSRHLGGAEAATTSK